LLRPEARAATKRRAQPFDLLKALSLSNGQVCAPTENPQPGERVRSGLRI